MRTTTHPSMRARRLGPTIAVIAAAITVAVAMIVLAVVRPGPSTSEAGPGVPAQAPTASVTPAPTGDVTVDEPADTLTASPSADPRYADCTNPAAGFVPDRYTIERFGVDEPVVALNLDEDGNIAAPPLNEPRMASWWSGGPKPGDSQGKAIMSIHTYRGGDALGNELYADGTSQFREGDLIKLWGPAGEVQCYEYISADHVRVADYDPSSKTMIDFDGTPGLSVIICWDFNKGTEVWESRVFFRFLPVRGAA